MVNPPFDLAKEGVPPIYRMMSRILDFRGWVAVFGCFPIGRCFDGVSSVHGRIRCKNCTLLASFDRYRLCLDVCEIWSVVIPLILRNRTLTTKFGIAKRKVNKQSQSYFITPTRTKVQIFSMFTFSSFFLSSSLLAAWHHSYLGIH
jgi:hypothetical protein